MNAITKEFEKRGYVMAGPDVGMPKSGYLDPASDHPAAHLYAHLMDFTSRPMRVSTVRIDPMDEQFQRDPEAYISGLVDAAVEAFEI